MYATYKELLSQLISFPSISTDPAYLPAIQETAAFLAGVLKENGFEVRVVEGYDHPIICASHVVDATLPTILVYGHYDVQPARQDEGWEEDPFKLSEHDGRLVARGAVDNKGQLLIHLVAISELIKQKKLRRNVKFFIEGNEESGSAGLEKFLRDHQQLMQADAVLISDGSMLSNLQPTVEVSFRSSLNGTIILRTSDQELHSGLYGGVVPNAVHELASLLAKVFLPDGKVALPDFYAGCPEITPDLLENNAKIPFDEAEFLQVTGVRKVVRPDGLDIHTLLGVFPSLEVTGLQSGYTGDGYKNSVPSQAEAKFNIRLAPSQDLSRVGEMFINFIKSLAPDYVSCEVRIDQNNRGVTLKVDNPFAQEARQILGEVYGKEPLLKYCGASLPVVTDFAEIFNCPQLLVSLANEDCRMHAVGENFVSEYIEKGLQFSSKFFGE